MSNHCKFVATDRPRVLPGRHNEDCAGDCAGCLACPMDHCRVCSVVHAEQTCAGCITEVRENLADLSRLYDDLYLESENRGVTGEAFLLLGPTANPEARGHIRASVSTGRVAADYEGHVPRDKHGNELADYTPLWVLGSWAMVYRDAFDHDEPDGQATVATESGYLDRNLSRAAGEPWVPFADFARDLRGSLNHIKRPLHDEDYGERANVTCFDCGGTLERKLTFQGFDDAWTCSRCRRRYSIAEYNLALRTKLEESSGAS